MTPLAASTDPAPLSPVPGPAPRLAPASVRPSGPSRLARGLAGLMSLLLLGGVAACDSPVPSPHVPTAQGTAPTISQAQEQKVKKAIYDVLAVADSTKDPAKLATRFSGPELQIRTSQLTVAKDTNTTNAKMEIPTGIVQTVLPHETGWPRIVYTTTTPTADQQSQRLLVFEQASARSNYKLWGMVRLFSGANLPEFPVPTIGARQGTLGDTGLVNTPKEAVKMYADLLQNGDKSPAAGKFGDDEFRTNMQQLVDAVQQGVAANNGSQALTFVPDIDSATVMRTADGGDLVVARIDSTWERSAGDGRESRPASAAEQALYGQTTYTSKIKVTSVNVVALYVPSAAAKSKKVQAVGAESQPVKVEAE